MQRPDTGAERAAVPVPILRAAAALVLAAGLVSGALAFYRDFHVAFVETSRSNVPASIARQIAEIEARVPAGEPLLLVSETRTEELWYARLLQRLFYPRNAVLIRYAPLTRADAEALRRRWSIRYGLALAVRPPDLAFEDAADLGALPAMDHHVWFGAMSAP